MRQRQSIQVEQGGITDATDFLLGEQGQPSPFGNTNAFSNIFGNVESISASGNERGQPFGNRVPPGGGFGGIFGGGFGTSAGNNTGSNSGETKRKLFQKLIQGAFGVK